MLPIVTFDWIPLAKNDVGAWAELLAAVEATDRIGEHYSADDLAEQLANPLLDVAEGTLAAWDGGRMVAAGLTACRPAADPVHQMSLWGAVHPDYRRRGLGGHLLDWAIRTTPVLHGRRFPGSPLELHVYLDDGNEGAKTMVTRAGMAPVRWFHSMSRDLGTDLPASDLPDGLEIVTYRVDLADAARRVRNASFTDHWGSVPHTPESWKSFITGVQAFRPEGSFVVRDGAGESVAVLLTHYFAADTEATGVREAWIQIVGTLREWRGRGVAAALLAHALAEFRAQGYQKAGLGVDADNPTGALGVYTRAGFVVEHRATTYALPIG